MSDASHGSGLREHILMVSRFLRSPSTVGAVSASSRAMARKMVGAPADRPPGDGRGIGPGTGPFTNAIVERVAAGLAHPGD